MSEPREIPIEWNVPLEMRAEFANHLLVTHLDGQFVLTFFEAMFPVILDGDTKGVDSVSKIPAHAVCRLAVPPEKLKSMINVLSRNYERYENQREEQDNESKQ